jgi:hypothetical protein
LFLHAALPACICLQGSSCRALLRQWEPLLLSWHDSSAAAKQELLDKLGSAEMAFYLACRDEAVYTQVSRSFADDDFSAACL